ncbi:MAG: A24 family peptidase [Planctomycetia bacterium]|nr:A24 family peptidase [Planctomycetia bacterium]
MNLFLGFLSLPLGVRLSLAALVGMLLAAVVNWATYSLAYEPRFHSPWSRRHPRDTAFGPSDRLPIYGWWRLRRMAPTLGRGFWIRPLLIEIGCAIGIPCWYWWETVQGGLLSPPAQPPAIAADVALSFILHVQFFVHLVLGMFMLAASLIDADERNIPDAVTVPGTLLGLALLTLLPWGLLPHLFDLRTGRVLPLDAAAPEIWPQAVFGGGRTIGLIVGLACFWLWCWGLIFGGRLPPLKWNILRVRRTARVTMARIRLDPSIPWVVGTGIVGSALIGLVWNYEALRWGSLLTALIGLAGGAAIVWIVRILGGWAFQKEAMGFGDVTLMAMIGAYLGWQPALIVFFAAPIAALILCLPSWFFGTREMLPYGPYLCSAAMAVILAWSPVWEWASDRFMMAWLVPGVLVVGFLLLGCSLALLRALRSFGSR